ncbi:MAG: hypothetical protein KC482_14225 [Dehalococcoidia bacterium]|nr:hypothetical protein [Dehalococcoidia bacterium]
METRVDLSDEALAVALHLAASTGQTLSEVIEELVRRSAEPSRADLYEQRRDKIERDIAQAIEDWESRHPAP